ncbi:hypothetical protein CK203_010678 [Vitis vinifera]|uniref:Reverse transcriptase domain-containing protein n=1 Tax=Vitis vinifera TaxID=29760 RepID=A0A438JT67_VITVI|nr:hypothetical protein CK203_010678 [Vitis vinifera]
MGFFREFHERSRFVKSLNATFLVLVPKKGGVEDLNDFKPISLVGSLYKSLAKVLANRIKRVMGKVISKPQNAFVEGRQILDAVLIANEVVDSRLKSNQGGFFQSSRGLRQGDPLSPYLFVIAMEMFSCLLRRAISGGFLSGWKVRGWRGEGILISQLLFTDSTLVFCEESHDQLTYLSWLLMWFEACSGLRVNLEKNKLIPMGRVHDIEDLALELGCKVGGLPSCYLSLPLGAPFKSEVVWDGVEERKVRLRLEKIQRNFLWGGGTLVQRPHLVSKWNWHFAIESEALWKQVISHKYDVEEGGMVHSGRKREDKWCGDEPLCKSFPSLFAISMAKDAWVSDVWSPDGVGDAFRVQRKDEDKVVWIASKSGAFSVKLLYSILEPGGSSLFPCGSIWRANVPPKMQALWNLIFSLLGVAWVLSSSVKETLIG